MLNLMVLHWGQIIGDVKIEKVNRTRSCFNNNKTGSGSFCQDFDTIPTYTYAQPEIPLTVN